MGLFGLTLKKIENFGDNVWHDLTGNHPSAPNPGNSAPQAGWVSPQVQAANQAAANSPAPPTNHGLGPAPQPQVNTANPMGLAPGMAPPVATPHKEDVIHNPVTDWLGTNIVKPVVAPVIQFGKAIEHTPQMIAADVSNNPVAERNTTQQTFGTTDPGKVAEKIIGSTAGTALTVAAPTVDSALTGAAEKFVPGLAAKTIGAAGTSAGFGASTGMAQGEDAQHVKFDAAVGGLTGGVATGVVAPAAKAAFRAAAPGVKEVAAQVSDMAKPEVPTQTPTFNVKPKAQSTLADDANLPSTTANAAKTLDALYNEKAPQAADANNLVNMAIGHARRFSTAGDQLETAIQHDFTPEEQAAARDNLEGIASGIGSSPRVQALTKLMGNLNERGYDVLDNSSKDTMHRVQQYATRVAKSSRNPNAVADKPVQQGFNDIRSIFDVRSGFSQNRAVQKFVSSTGDVKYGTEKELGLTANGNRLVDQNGTHWKPVATSTRELNANGYDYENNYGKVANTYHSSVGRVKAALDAKAELVRDPEHYGLTKTPPDRGYDAVHIPELDGYYAPTKVARKITQELGHPTTPSISEKAFQGVTRGVVQSIVLNPMFHARNLNELAGLAAGKAKGMFGPLMLKKAYVDLAMMSEEDKSALYDRMLKSGVIKETYGADRDTVLSKALDQANLPHINKASASAMGNIDWGIRSSLFHLVTSGDSALSDEQAAALVNHFLGDTEATGPIARNLGLFWHYMKTRVNVVKDVVQHPNENSGTIAAGAVQAATLFAATKAFQEWTGNKHASLGHPGIAGLVNIADQVAHGHGASAVTSSINPLVTAALNQLYGKDLYTGNPLTDTKSREQNAVQTLFAPDQNISKVQEGKSTVGEQALRMLTGVSTPHASGNVATTNPNLSFLNTPGATENKQPGTNDPTGYSQQQRAIEFEKKMQGQLANNPNALNAYNTLKNYNKNAPGTKFTPTTTPDQEEAAEQAKVNTLINLSKDPAALQAYVSYMTYDKTPDGKIALRSPQETASAWGQLAAHPSALDAIQKQEQANPQHSPQWDITGNGVDGNNKVAPKMYVFSLYKSLSPNDPQRTVILQNNPWISDVENKVANYITSLPKGDAVPGKDYIPYPTTDPAVQSKLDEIKAISAIPGANRTTEQIDRLSTLESDPAVRNTYATKEAYDAAVRNNWGLPPTTSTTTNDGGVGTITTLAKAYGLDPKAVLSVAAHEGLSGGVGDNGTSFGPFQLHAGGALPQSVWAQGADYAHKWAWSPAGIEYAISTMANAGAKGKTGTDAISAITNNFERPADPNGEINAAVGFYNNPDQIQQIAGNSTSIYSPQVAEFAKEYQAATKETRNFMRAQNPDLYTAMQEYMTQADMTTAERGMADAYYGADPSSSTLGAVYNLGTYDIAKNKADNGVNVYSMPPPSVTGYNSKTGAPEIGVAGSSSQTSSAAFTKYANQVKAASQARDAEHAAKAEKGLIKQAQRAAKLRGPKPMTIHMPDQTNVTPYRIKGATLAPRRVNKVALKPQNTLKISNHAKLKT